MKRKRIIGAAMAATVALSSFGLAGCGKQSSDTGKLGWWLYTSDSSGGYYESYDDNPAIQWLNAQYWDVEKGGLGTEENGTNVQFTFQTPVAGAEQDNFNTMMSTGEYPEIIDLTIADTPELLYDEGILMDITEYVEKYMPNYLAALEKYPEMKQHAQSVDEDGNVHYYHIAGYSNGKGDAWGGYLYRRDWIVEYAEPTEYVWDWDSDYVKENGHPAVTPLAAAQEAGNLEGWKKNELYGSKFSATDGEDPKNTYEDNVIFPSGKDYPYTVSDWEWMLEAFQRAIEDKGFAGNSDAYPLSLYYMGSLPMGDLVSSFGGSTGSWYIDENREVSYSGTDDNFKLYLECMHQWYENGWIDSVFETRASDMFFSINQNGCAQGMVGLWYGTVGLLGNTIRVTCTDPEDQQKAYVMGCASPVNDVYGAEEQKYKEPDALYQDSRIGKGIGITTKAEEKEDLLPALCTFLDYTYDEEAMGQTFIGWGLSKEQYESVDPDPDIYAENGLENGAYTWTEGEDGIPCMKLNFDNSSDLAAAIKAMRLGIGLGMNLHPDDGSYTVDTGVDEVVRKAQEQFSTYTNTGNILPYTAFFSEEESDIYNKTNNALTEYTSQVIPQMIKEGLDGWDAYVEKSNSYEPEKVSEILQQYVK